MLLEHYDTEHIHAVPVQVWYFTCRVTAVQLRLSTFSQLVFCPICIICTLLSFASPENVAPFLAPLLHHYHLLIVRQSPFLSFIPRPIFLLPPPQRLRNMGLLRNRFRDRSRPPPGPPADMSPVVPSSPTDDIPLKSPLRRTNPPARVVQGSSSGRSLGSVWSGGRSSSGPSARSSLLDQASRLRRFLRERKPQSHSSADSTTVDDVPDTPDVFPEALSDAEFSIAAAARDSSSLPRSTYNPPVASGSSSVSSNVRYATSPTSAYQRDSSTSTAPRGPISLSGNRGLPNEMQQGETCTDGCLTFVVPPGWIATRTMDSFCLVNNLSLGFVRAVKASNAAEALLETDRLQVMSHVTALSSPVFDENGNFATVNYLSTMGKGKG